MWVRMCNKSVTLYLSDWFLHSFSLALSCCPSQALHRHLCSLFPPGEWKKRRDSVKELQCEDKAIWYCRKSPIEEGWGELNKRGEWRRCGSVHPSWPRRTDTTKDGVLGEASRLRGAGELETIFFGACQAVQYGRPIYELSSTDVMRLINLL